MSAGPTDERWPIFPELGVGLAAGCLILAGLSLISMAEDRFVMAGGFGAIALTAAVAAVLFTPRRG
jgi:hypothetical protein